MSPIWLFLGGIVTQEIIKYTRKFAPIDHWLWFEFSELVDNLPENTDRPLKKQDMMIK